MNRIVFWFLATVTVVVLLFGYHTSTSGPAGSAPLSAIADPTPGAASGSASGSASGAAGSTTEDSGSSASTTVTGSEAQTQWGPVQVELTIAGGKITDVAVPVYPDGNGRDAEINSFALPQLIQETISAQSADIDMVSGATVTSDGYLQSLQSALDKAGL
ncbi:FMN-binding protein [Nocardioides sp. BP30]|uniref:FMN-binding protein n=1 Tax=Nocardioides sp. BP30 TaxID=3036374 RepID=UPI0024696BFA|nr:FMN-binding protein [Nocardioides sp. BP30]WGL51587.1 FMN-binding protein [Nocardioides sp. BP30]